jgi:hypothetical protein
MYTVSSEIDAVETIVSRCSEDAVVITPASTESQNAVVNCDNCTLYPEAAM